MQDIERRFRRLRIANIVLALLHAAQAAVILLLSNDFGLPVTENFLEGPPGVSELPAAETLFDLPLGPAVAALPVYYVLISWAAWRGLFEFVWAPSRWNKTDHGLARTSRLRTLKRLSGDPWRLLRARGRP